MLKIKGVMFVITPRRSMQLPLDLQEKVNEIYKELSGSKITKIQGDMTFSYKNKSGRSESLIKSKEDAILYSISRMPATYAVVSSVLEELFAENLIKDVSTVADIGSGTGTSFFAWKNLDENVQVFPFEKEQFMIDVFNKFEKDVCVKKCDVTCEKPNVYADLVMSSYVLSELVEKDRVKALENMILSAKKYILLIDTGTPKTFDDYMKIKEFLQKKGFKILAPCNSQNCGLKDDYCQFFARVERSSLLRQAKSANLSYEDEKYFYLFASKEDSEICENKRIIRRPIEKKGFVELKVCSKNGVENLIISKKNDNFKRVKKLKINQTF